MSETGTAGYLALARDNRDFRNLWFGQIVSLFGDWFNLIASAALVARLTGSGLAIGALFVVRMLAPFLVTPFAGVATDRYSRKTLLIVADVVRAVVVLGFLFVRSPANIWLLYALTAVQLGMQGVFFPARNAILPDIVSSRELGAANALTSTTWSVMLAFGAAVGGLVAGGWGVYPAFIIDSLTFLLSAMFIAQVRYERREARSVPSAGKGAFRSTFTDYLDGLRYLLEHPDILVITLHKGALGLFVVGAYEVIQVAIAKEVFVIGEAGGISLGIFYATVGVGTGVGPIVARYFTGDRDQALRRVLLLAYIAMAAGLAILSTLASLELALLGVLLRAAGGGTVWVMSTQLLLQLVPDSVRGRVLSTEFAFLTLSMAVSAGLSGWALDSTGIGIAGALEWMAWMTLLPALLWGSWLFHQTKRR